MSKNRTIVDSVALASVKILTMATSIVSTMILSRTLPLANYGTYTTGNLITNTATLLTAFGLIDAVNYYYNGKKSEERDSYVNTVFALFIICGVIAAGAILAGNRLISAYFHNPALGSVYIYVAFRPLALNLGSGLQNLQVSIGKARAVAIRNTIMSLTKLTAIIITTIFTKNITTIFICMLSVEGFSLIFYYKVLKDNKVFIRPLQFDFSKLKEILIFCIPMGIYIQTNSLSRDIDKYVIGFYESTEKLAIYANCATKLPFDVVSGPLLTLLIPILTRCIRNDDYNNGSKLFKSYLKIGYTFTMTFGVACMVLGKEAVRFLYGEKYLDGIVVFLLFIVVDMINFISFSLVLSARGKTKTLMKASTTALLANLIINFGFYKIFGFVGPALATVLITLVLNARLLKYSSNVLKVKLHELFEIKHISILIVELGVMAVITSVLRFLLEKAGVHYFIILATLGALSVGTILFLNLKDIKHTFDDINRISNKEKNTY